MCRRYVFCQSCVLLSSLCERQMCVGDSLCYLENSAIADFLNRPDVRELLGAQTPNNFSACSREVSTNFNAHLDKYAVPSQYYVSGLLERGIPILIYAGTYDWQCNWVANKLWVDKLEWTGQQAYNSADWRDWMVEGNRAGETKKAGALTFATIRGAGHMGEPEFSSDSNGLVRLTGLLQFPMISPPKLLRWCHGGCLVKNCDTHLNTDVAFAVCVPLGCRTVWRMRGCQHMGSGCGLAASCTPLAAAVTISRADAVPYLWDMDPLLRVLPLPARPAANQH